ncbi:hypothetical protein ACFW93_46075 [Streptomyces canus]|uniref:hypothetical protein n=1 Tax=Streptomyces canus TaxID=58343 RepID=UPI0036A76C8E
MNGVHTAVLVTGILALMGAASAAFGLRGREDGTQENSEHTEHDARVPSPATVRSSVGVPVSGHVIGAESDNAYTMDAPGAGSQVLIASAEGYRPQASRVVVGGEPVSYDTLLAGTRGLVGTSRSADLGKPGRRRHDGPHLRLRRARARPVDPRGDRVRLPADRAARRDRRAGRHQDRARTLPRDCTCGTWSKPRECR